MTGQLCMCCDWDRMNLCYCGAAVTFYFLCVFVNCFVACIAVVSRGVMIGMSGESWRQKSSQDWVCRLSSFLLCFRLSHFLYLYLVSIFISQYLYIYLFSNL